MDNTLKNILSFIDKWKPQSQFNYGYTGQPGAPAQAQVSAIPQQTASPSPIAQAQQIAQQPSTPSADLIRQNISKLYGADNPILNNLPDLLQAGQQTPDPYMPIIMALRETQGGKDLADPNKNAHLGKNNIFNIVGQQAGNSNRFINYPDVHTAIFGGQNGSDTSAGFTGQVNGPIYRDYQQSKDLHDFFKHYSPPTDNNGNLDEQVQNYNWIRSHVLGI